ncbi:YcaQ family DNA glycosylase [candidate division KSB1 bacterium]|nr:YcaQ family DNA glycosylase [candidate division KSB1 bacterium]
MKHINISQNTARQLALGCQLLHTSNKKKLSLLDKIEALSYVQIDTIAVIQRAHHHTLWVRHSEYGEDMLNHLQTVDRAIFEYWAHAMAYIPMKDYRFYLPKMRQFEKPASKWAQQALASCRDIMPHILKRIRKEGPLGAKDFEAPPNRKNGSWWDWKPAKLALEQLFWRGELMITERRKFQKIYDLTERVLPDHIDTRIPSSKELGHFIVKRALSSFGIAQEREIRSFLQPDTIRDSDLQFANRKVVADALFDLIETGDVVPIKIGANEAIYYALSEYINNSDPQSAPAPSVILLAPFDNLIIQRDRTKWLFNFDYSLECYVPEPKRKFGYFVLPILWGDRFIGRLDPKADRKQKTMIIRNLVFEPDFQQADELLPTLATTLKEFASFNDCESIKFEKLKPAKLKKALERATK